MADPAAVFFELFNREPTVRHCFITLLNRFDANKPMSTEETHTFLNQDKGFLLIWQTLGTGYIGFALETIKALQSNTHLRQTIRQLILEIDQRGPLTLQDWDAIQHGNLPARLHALAQEKPTLQVNRNSGTRRA